jgi:hypothetical protein
MIIKTKIKNRRDTVKKEVRDGTKERNVLHSLISDKLVLSHLSAKWTKTGLLRSPQANVIGQLCVEYYKKFQEPPGYDQLPVMFQTWSENKHEDSANAIERLLRNLVDEHEQNGKVLNSKYLLENAKEHVLEVNTESHYERGQAYLKAGKVQEAVALAEAFKREDIGSAAGSNLFTDENALDKIFNKQRYESLIQYDGALGKFFGQSLRRGGFVSILAPEKTGKTAWLVDMSYQAILQRHHVAYFSIGDEDVADIEERMIVRCSRHPMYTEEEWPLKVRFPLSIEPPEYSKDGKFKSALVEFETKVFEKPLNRKAVQEVLSNVKNNKIRIRDSPFRVMAYPSLGVNVPDIEVVIKSWVDDGWVPDIVVIDYPDNLAPMSGYKEKRDQINTTWQRLRALSQAPYFFCVLVATQSNALGYSKILLDRSNFSDSKTKLAAITGMFGLNVYGDEKLKGITRLNWIERRKGESKQKICHVAGSLAIASPAILSTFNRRKKEEE